MKLQEAVATAHHSVWNTDAENVLSFIQISGTLEEINAKITDLRDYFAAKAMQALTTTDVGATLIARTAYSIADAMLEARKK